MQKQVSFAVVALVFVIFVVGWMVRVESELRSLRKTVLAAERVERESRRNARAPVSSSSAAELTKLALNETSPGYPAVRRSLSSVPTPRDISQGEKQKVALEERMEELESALEEIGHAWNSFAEAEEHKAKQAERHAWSPAQAAGAPDTQQDGDYPTAWASLHPDGGMEWLQTQYAKPVEVAQVRVRETYNPGAVVKITGVTPGGAEVVLWQGNEPQLPAPADQVFNIPAGQVVGSVRVHLDTKKVPGWNEIDAVELVGRDGTRQWANEATASSTYGTPRMRQ